MKLLSLARRWESVLAAVLAIVLGTAAWLDPAFMALSTQLELSTHAVELLIVALPMTFVILSGGIDLSVGSSLALAAVIFGLSYEAGAPVWAASVLGVLTGSLCGIVNGAFIAGARVHPLIVTLATLAAYRGLAEGISLGRPISGFPDRFLAIGEGSVGGVPYSLLIAVAAVLAFALTSTRTVFGRRVYAIGSNEIAARYAGVPIARMKLWLYGIAGTVAGLAGIIHVARRNTAKADVLPQVELDVITAVVLGGTSIFGGRGSVVGTVLGVLVIHEVREFVGWRWQRDELILVVVGSILIVSVLAHNLVARRAR
ncbi:MAG: ABC transporter permease [Phycisphaerales bacterium]|nr:ABC transporter permease [Phycisphaerales bacterium]